jgi:hypothetical protein
MGSDRALCRAERRPSIDSQCFEDVESNATWFTYRRAVGPMPTVTQQRPIPIHRHGDVGVTTIIDFASRGKGKQLALRDGFARAGILAPEAMPRRSAVVRSAKWSDTLALMFFLFSGGLRNTNILIEHHERSCQALTGTPVKFEPQALLFATSLDLQPWR